jgi:hypothetical protein
MSAMAIEAWCLDVVGAENDKLKKTAAVMADPASCAAARDDVRRAMKAHPPVDAGKCRQAQ